MPTLVKKMDCMLLSDIGVSCGCQNQWSPLGRRSETLVSHAHHAFMFADPPQLDTFKLDDVRLAIPFSLPIHCRSANAGWLVAAARWSISGPAQMRVCGCNWRASLNTCDQSTMEAPGELAPSSQTS